MELKEYYNNPRISQSKLKLLLTGPEAFMHVKEPEMYFEEKKYFIIGSAVDCILTQSQKIFEETYHISNIKNKPSDIVKSILKQTFDKVLLQNKEVGRIVGHVDVILECCNLHNYQSKWNDNTRVNKICEFYEYWEDLKLSYGKQIISQEEYNIINNVVLSLRTNETTSKYFKTDKLKEIVFQLPIFFTYDEIECKTLLDMVILDHGEKTIQPIDIKTIGDYTFNFPQALKLRRYDIQASFYTEALKSQECYCGYKILPFKFIVESTIYPGNPLVFTCNKELLEIGKYGRKESYFDSYTAPSIEYKKEIENWDLDKPKPASDSIVYTQKINAIKGFKNLIEDFKYYVENGFDKHKDVKLSQGEFEINWSGII